MNGKIYRLSFKHNPKKSYIGQTINSIERRVKDHIINSRKTKTYLSNAITKYGEENILVELLEDNITKKNEINNREIYWISQYNSFLGEGYNMTKGGDGGSIRLGVKNTKEHNQKISESQKGKSKKDGNKCGQYMKSESHKKKLSSLVSDTIWMSKGDCTIKIKKHLEKEYKRKGYIRGRGNYTPTPPKKGYYISEAQKKKISKKLKSRKRVICPYCGKEGVDYAMPRYHFNNCKYK